MKYINKQKLKNPNGFTLAEVLITLVIIGVIAAMVVPTIIQNSNESATVSKVKKGLSILGQAKILAEAQHGPIADWDYQVNANTNQSRTNFVNYIKPYLSVVKLCSNAFDCALPQHILTLNGNTYNPDSNTFYGFVLSDGSTMFLFTPTIGKCSYESNGISNQCAYVMQDVNGEKEPNTYGRDIFFYYITSNGVFPYTQNDCNKTDRGYGCSSYIIKNSNMKYLH